MQKQMEQLVAENDRLKLSSVEHTGNAQSYKDSSELEMRLQAANEQICELQSKLEHDRHELYGQRTIEKNNYERVAESLRAMVAAEQAKQQAASCALAQQAEISRLAEEAAASARKEAEAANSAASTANHYAETEMSARLAATERLHALEEQCQNLKQACSKIDTENVLLRSNLEKQTEAMNEALARATNAEAKAMAARTSLQALQIQFSSRCADVDSTYPDESIHKLLDTALHTVEDANASCKRVLCEISSKSVHETCTLYDDQHSNQNQQETLDDTASEKLMNDANVNELISLRQIVSAHEVAVNELVMQLQSRMMAASCNSEESNGSNNMELELLQQRLICERETRTNLETELASASRMCENFRSSAERVQTAHHASIAELQGSVKEKTVAVAACEAELEKCRALLEEERSRSAGGVDEASKVELEATIAELQGSVKEKTVAVAACEAELEKCRALLEEERSRSAGGVDEASKVELEATIAELQGSV
eukprot:SAG31_NODE_3139_length_4631_cov_3.420565_2_plen_489_part_01